MYHLHLTRNLRSLVFLLIAAGLAAGVILLWWANRSGLPDSWRTAIEREISRNGMHVKMETLRYIPLRGIVARDVRVFSDPLHKHEISRLESILLGFDITKLARGEFRLNKMALRNAALSLPLDPDNPEAGMLVITDAHGTLFMPGHRRLEIRNARGRISGIEVTLNAYFTGYQNDSDTDEDASQSGKRRQLLARVIKQLEPWHFDKEQPPSLAIFMDGNANDRSALVVKMTFDAHHLEKNQHRLEDVHMKAEISGELVTITALRARDSRGVLDARIDYDLAERAGRFDVQSSLEITPLLSAWMEQKPPAAIVIGGAQELLAEGEFHMGVDDKPRIHMTGRAAAEEVMLKGIRFSTAETAFAWREGDLFLRDLQVSRADGTATGKALIQWPLVRLSLRSTLPGSIYKPLFAGMPLEQVIDNFSDRKGATYDIRIDGGFDATDKHSWAYSGGGKVENVNYRGVPVESAECEFTLSHHELDFHDGKVVFNHDDYPLRAAFNGPSRSTANVGRIRYVGADKLVEIEDVEGSVWAAPLLRLFAPKVADSLEIYRFHQPPSLRGSGVVDVTPRGRTALDVTFKSGSAADYTLLGQNVTLSQPAGKVEIRGPRIVVSNLKTNAFDGPVAAAFTYQDGELSGETSWTKLSLRELASTYGFQTKAGGEATGRLAFSINRGRIETLQGDGLLALEKAELFSVPIFGPLSQLISGALNDRRAGFERSKSAFCTFKINNGILRTRDMQTSTTSLTFAGDGDIDLSNKTLEMTIRMNARGLLGLLTLPLRPFSGMFQFRGTGPINNPEWENVMFTPPPKEQQEILQSAPRARIVGPAR